MNRRFGETPKAGVRYTRRPGAYALIAQGDDLLLTFQDAPEPEFQLPGGGIDPGESAIQALHREAYEETGWKIGGLRRLGLFRRYTFMPEYDLWAEKICLIYAASPIRCFGEPVEPGHTALWVPREDAIRLLANAGDRHFAATYF